MIDRKVLGAYAAIGALPPDEQAGWYRRAAGEWKLSCFEIPLLAGVPLSEPLQETFSEVSASLVVTLVAQWAGKGQSNVAYGLGSTEEQGRREAVLDAQSVIQQCLCLQREGIGIAALEVHVGQRTGGPVAHSVSLYRSLLELRGALAAVLPDCRLAVEITDSLAADHAIPFPSAKKASLNTAQLLEAVSAANAPGAPPVSAVINWGRLLINGDRPLDVVEEVLASPVPLAGVILSGAAATPDGFADGHNSHLDPASGFTLADGEACAERLTRSAEPAFLGMKCSAKTGPGVPGFDAAEVLQAEADFLNRV